MTKVTAGNMSNCRFGRRNNAEEQEFSGLGSVGSLDPVEREVGDRGGGVVGDEMRFVVDVGELDAIGVPRRVAADTLQSSSVNEPSWRPNTTRVGTVSRRRR